MQSYTADIYNVATPTGVDIEIGKVQTKLAAMGWLHTIYGRAAVQRRQLTKEEIKNQMTPGSGAGLKPFYYYPQGRYRGQDFDLSINDTLPTACFFYLRDPTNVNPASDNWTFDEQQVMVAQPMSMILYGDFTKLTPGSIDDYSEVLKTQILAKLQLVPRIVVTNIFSDFDNVLKDFSVTQKNSIFTRYPYFAYRFDFTLTYPAFPENT